MAALTIELPARGGSRYHKIEQAVTRVGRALDNDIVLSDPTVSPYHFLIRRNPDGEHELHSLADENGVRVGRRQIDRPLKLNELPLEFDAGRTRVRILDRSQPVAPTRLISCRNGRACLFGHWGWAFLLFGAMLLLSALDNFLSTPEIITWDSFGRDQLNITLAALTLSAGLLVINRMTSQRWDYPSSLSMISLILTVVLLLDPLTNFADYLFTSPLPGYVINLLWTMLLLPAAFGWFLLRLHHGNTTASLLLIIALLTPGAYLQLREIVDHYNPFDTFDDKAYYSDTLHPWDKRLRRTISIDEFAMQSARNIVPAFKESK